jgi:hypothetical protein
MWELIDIDEDLEEKLEQFEGLLKEMKLWIYKLLKNIFKVFFSQEK